MQKREKLKKGVTALSTRFPPDITIPKIIIYPLCAIWLLGGFKGTFMQELFISIFLGYIAARGMRIALVKIYRGYSPISRKVLNICRIVSFVVAFVLYELHLTAVLAFLLMALAFAVAGFLFFRAIIGL